jgi:signal peptidase I
VLVLKPLAPQRFDVVVLKEPDWGGNAIKRVVGVPGDTVSMVPRVVGKGRTRVLLGSQLYVNGQPYEEPYASSVLPRTLAPTRIPDGSYFVMGDNRDLSTDSRQYGPVSRRRIHGVAVAVVYPFSEMRIIKRGSELAAGAAAPSL